MCGWTSASLVFLQSDTAQPGRHSLRLTSGGRGVLASVHICRVCTLSPSVGVQKSLWVQTGKQRPCEMPTGPNEEAEQRAAVVSGAVETGAGAGGAESRGEDGELLRSVTSSQCGRVPEHKTTSDCEDQSDASRRGSSRGTC